MGDGLLGNVRGRAGRVVVPGIDPGSTGGWFGLTVWCTAMPSGPTPGATV